MCCECVLFVGCFVHSFVRSLGIQLCVGCLHSFILVLFFFSFQSARQRNTFFSVICPRFQTSITFFSRNFFVSLSPPYMFIFYFSSFFFTQLFFDGYLMVFFPIFFSFSPKPTSRYDTIYRNFRSVPLKSQLNTYTEKGKIPVLDFLSTALESVEYERALTRGLVSVCIRRFFSFARLFKVYMNFTYKYIYCYVWLYHKLFCCCCYCCVTKFYIASI